MKLKEKTKKKIRGSITILLIILMLPSMTLSAIVVDSSRINMARSMVSSAGDLAMNTALANYDTILKDVYGLFAMSQNETDEELADRLRDYFATTLVSYGVVNEAESGEYVDALIGDFREIISNTRNGQASNFLDMNVVDFTVTKVENSSLADPAIMRSQIVEYMKYRAPLNFGLSFLDSINAFKNVQDQTDVVQKQVEAQQEVQDVTDACQKIIASIREYDKLMKSIKEGDKAVKGKADSTDGQIVDIGEYHTQVDKYYSTWNYNYSHANMLNLVFLLKSPSVDSLYLKGLDINSSKFFINSTGTSILYDGSGISLNPTLESTASAAKTQVDNQMQKLNNPSGLEKITATNYVEKDYLSTSYVTSTGNAFIDETAAINTFIEFEKFLTNDGSLKYSDVKTTLESIYTLGKYYDNYYAKISAEITTAEQKMNEAKGKVTAANTNASTYYNNVSTYVTKINNANENYEADYTFLSGIKNASNEDLQTVVSNLLAETNFAMPTGTTVIGGKTFVSFGSFTNVFKENNSDSDNKYLKVLGEIINSSLKNDATYGSVCTTASSYFLDIAANRTNKPFTDYFKQKLGNEIENNNLFILLNHLYTNSDYVERYIKGNIISYNEVLSGYQDLVNDANEKTQEYETKDAERNSTEVYYKDCLVQYIEFVKAYQTDLQYYGKYISSAQATIGTEVSAINAQFTHIKNNVKSLIDQLEVIEGNLESAKSEINAYNNKVEAWQNANSTYQTNNGSDSFSKQNAADAQTSLNQYKESDLTTLTAYVGSIKAELQDFYDVLIDGTHFKYGSKKIDTITVADHMKAAVSETVKNSLPAVVTVADANAKLSSLYSSEATGELWIADPYFLNPVLQIQFLKYLNEAYPESTTTTSTTVKVEGQDVTVGTEGDFDFDEAKEDLKNNSGGEVVDETNADTFGYSYKDKEDLDKSKLPSKDAGTKTVNKTEFNIGAEGEDTDDIDVSSGFSVQNSALGDILAGIEDVAENTLENSYIMSYIFNNFSYNTLIQDEVVDKENVDNDGKSPLEAMSDASKLFDDTNETFTSIKDKTTTLSNYTKNKNNNYLYGAEIEYLLYGNVNASKNVTYTKASIYAIRFAFNCIYAFTNSEIRNSTMSVGLAVQAATLGIVPYQIVQIVLQLALAAAESAMDLSMMNNGLKVAIVKTNDTWSLSISSAVKFAGDMVADATVAATKNAISSVSSGLQGIVDASADKLDDSIENLQTNLEEATEGKIEEVVDGAFGIIQSKIEEALNSLQFINFHDEAVNVTTEINNAFDGLETSINTELTNSFGGNPVADAVLPYITEEISTIVASIKADVTSKIADMPKTDIGAIIVEEMTNLKLKLISYSSDAVSTVLVKVSGVATDITSGVKEQLNQYIDKTAEDMTEAASKEIKDGVTQATNDFINNYLDSDSTTTIGSAASGKASSSVASMIKFGYKDYLMLFVFISLSVSDASDPVVARIADLVELNIQHASGIEDSNYKHKKGTEFKMKDATTYVSIHAETELDMLFMNMDFFTSLLEDDETEVSGQFTPAATIEYNGLFGY